MKITVQNIVNEYPKIGIELPEPLAKDKFEKLKSTFLPNYNKSDVIKKMVDTFVLKLNELLAKEAEEQKDTERKQQKPLKTPKKPQEKEVENAPKNLAELKRYLKEGMYLWHFYKKPQGWIVSNHGRPIKTIQNNAISFLTE